MKAVLIAICVSAMLCASFAGSAAGSGASPAATHELRELDQRVLSEVNRTRVERGLRRLFLSNGLQKAAGAHSRQMLDGGFFAHDSTAGVRFAKRVRGYYSSDGYSTWSIGENLLYSTGEITAETAVKAWLDSPEHRETMLSPGWREVGIASLRTRAAGGLFGGKATWVITMDFGVRSGKASGSRSPAVSRSTTLPTRAGPASLASSSRSSAARVVKPKRPAGTATKHPVTRVLPGGRATQTV